MPDPNKEREVVECLVAVHPIDVRRDALRTGDVTLGEPDVVGVDVAGRSIGFEVTEIVDPALARLMPEYLSGNEVLQDCFRRLTWSASGEHLPQGVEVSVSYTAKDRVGRPRNPSRRDKDIAAPSVVRQLLARGRGFNGRYETIVDLGRRGTIKADVCVDRARGTRCTFTCIEVVSFDVPIESTFRAKLSKRYALSTIHLVGFFERSPSFDDEGWKKRLRDLFFNEVEAAKFQSFHVLHLPRRAVMFRIER